MLKSLFCKFLLLLVEILLCSVSFVVFLQFGSRRTKLSYGLLRTGFLREGDVLGST